MVVSRNSMAALASRNSNGSSVPDDGFDSFFGLHALGDMEDLRSRFWQKLILQQLINIFLMNAFPL
jgi:hypothetical protein